MDHGFPGDWRSPLLQQLDDALRCQICKEPFTGPVALPCQHAFCSACIRSSFDVRIRSGHRPLCPLCNAPSDPADLRPVVPLRQAATLFAQARHLLLQLEQQQQQQGTPLPLQQQQQQQGACAQFSAPVEACPPLPIQPQPYGAGLGPSRGQVVTVAGARRSQQPGPPAAARGAASTSDSICIIEDSAEQPASSTATSSSSDPDWDVEDTEGGGQQQQQQPGGAAAGGGSQDSDWMPAGRTRKRSLTSAAAEVEDEHKRHRRHSSSSSRGVSPMGGHTPPPAQPAATSTQHGPLAGVAPAALPKAPLAKGYVECPVCGISVRMALIDRHVEHCLMRADTAGKQQSAPALTAGADARGSGGGRHASTSASAASAAAAQHRSHAGALRQGSSSSRLAAAGGGKPLEPPPKLCFQLMKVQELRKKLKEQGLSFTGEKEELVARYTAFRSFLLSAKDAGVVYTRQRAVKEFAQRNIHSSSEVLAGGGGLEAAAAAAGSIAAVLAAGPAGAAEGAGDLHEVPAAYSHNDLIREARRRMKQQKKKRAAAAAPAAGEAAAGEGAAAAAPVEGTEAAALPPLAPAQQQQQQQQAVHMAGSAAGHGNAAGQDVLGSCQVGAVPLATDWAMQYAAVPVQHHGAHQALEEPQPGRIRGVETGTDELGLWSHVAGQQQQPQVAHSWPADIDPAHQQHLQQQPQQQYHQQEGGVHPCAVEDQHLTAAATAAAGTWDIEQGGAASPVCLKPLQAAAAAAAMPLQELRNGRP